MNKVDTFLLLEAIADYLSSLPKDYTVCYHGKVCEKEYRHGRKRKIWMINIKLTRPLPRTKVKSSRERCPECLINEVQS